MAVKRMVGNQAPAFELDAVLPNKEFGRVSLEANMKDGKWTVLFSINGLHLCVPH